MIIHVLGQHLDHKKCGRFLRFGATAAPLIVYNRLHIHVQAVKVTWPYISTCGLVIRGCVLVDTLYLQMPRLQDQHYAIPLWTVAISVSHVSCSTAQHSYSRGSDCDMNRTQALPRGRSPPTSPTIEPSQRPPEAPPLPPLFVVSTLRKAWRVPLPQRPPEWDAAKAWVLPTSPNSSPLR